MTAYDPQTLFENDYAKTGERNILTDKRKDTQNICPLIHELT